MGDWLDDLEQAVGDGDDQAVWGAAPRLIRVARAARYVTDVCRAVARHMARNGSASNAPDPCGRCDICALRAALGGEP